MGRNAGIAPIAVAAAMAVVYVLEHVGAFTLISSHVDDLMLGRPMAVVFGIVGAAAAGT